MRLFKEADMVELHDANTIIIKSCLADDISLGHREVRELGIFYNDEREVTEIKVRENECNLEIIIRFKYIVEDEACQQKTCVSERRLTYRGSYTIWWSTCAQQREGTNRETKVRAVFI